MEKLSITPEEIKKGLECHVGETASCIHCGYDYFSDAADCSVMLCKDALALIQQLERDKNWASENYDLIREENKRFETQNAELLEKIKQLERERDAAVNDLSAGYRCGSCTRYFGNGGECPGGRFCILGGFEWRGPCEENGGSDA